MPILFLTAAIFFPFGNAAESLKDRRFTDKYGHIVHFNQPITRVISLAPSITEMLFELGVGDRLVGVTIHCNRPHGQTEKLAKVGSLLHFDAEKIVRLKPQLVLALASAGNPEREVEHLRRAVGEKVLVMAGGNLQDLLAMVRLLAEIFQVPEAGNLFEKRLQSTVATIHSKRVGKPTKRVAFLVGCAPEMAVGKQTFLHEWIGLAGAENLFGDKKGFVRVDMESLLAHKPDAILIALQEQRALCSRFQKRGKQLIKSKLFFLPEDLFQRPGPRTGQAIELLFNTLYGKHE